MCHVSQIVGVRLCATMLSSSPFQIPGLGGALDGSGAEMKELEQIPLNFSYRFRCDDEQCLTSHELQIQDWEIGESYRKWSRANPTGWDQMIRQRYERDLPARDLHLVVGNLAKHRQAFVIIGLVRPPRPKVDSGNVQQTFDLMGEKRPVARLGVCLETEEANALGGDERDESLELFPDE